ncbi:MAG: T9SS type A sorting domain-containing protein [Chitinophagaceae bacterium]|nr:MAG: T9SS type A sorting domain-containing protein [Chitinophagaceae bacterium]
MRLYLIIIFILNSFCLTAQRVCDVANNTQQYYRDANEDGPQSTVPPRDTSINEIITIPVVVHVLFNSNVNNISDAQVLSQIDVLNRDFRFLNADRSGIPTAFKAVAADARIMFCLAQVDPQGRPTTGILRRYTTVAGYKVADDMKFKSKGGSDAWDSKNYLNIWVCSMQGRAMGYATPPGGDPAKDGVVINYDVFGDRGTVRNDFNKGRTATHEIAHWLGLKHIWGDDDCGDDEVGDTPKQTSYNFGCPTFPRKTYCSPNNDGDMFMNFMDLTNDACMYMFTNGQKNKMRAQFALNHSRNSFLRSYRCDGSLASGAALPQDTLPVTIVAVKKEDPISIFPNPVQNELTIQAKEEETLSGKTAVLYNNMGTVVMSYVLRSKKSTIPMEHLLSGVYMLRIGQATEQKVFKLIKL